MAEGGPLSAASASASSKSEVNEQLLTSLVEMGIDRDSARQVLVCPRRRRRRLLSTSVSISGVDHCE